MNKQELYDRRITGMIDEIKREATDGVIHHARLASIARSWRWTYATGRVYAKKLNIRVK